MPIARANGKKFTFPEGTTPQQMGDAIDEYFASHPIDNALPESSEVDQAPKPERASIEDQMLQIPGMSAVAELASAANKSIFQFLDFVGADNVNAVLDIVGSDKKIPTLTESFGSDGGYMDEGLGRDVAQAVGKTLPVALGAGQAMRSVASKLPGAVASESAGAGVVRQMGQSTAKQDAVAGALSATGGELGEEIAGADGKLIGSVVAPLASAGPALAKSLARGPNARQMLNDSAPTSQDLKESARGLYRQLDEAGVVYSSAKLNPFIKETVSKIQREGFNSKIHPKVNAAMDELLKNSDKDLPLTELDTLRKVAKAAAKSIDPDEARLGSMLTERVDDFMANTKTNASEGATDQVRQLFSQARNLWGRARRTELIDEAIEKAQNQASGFENGLRVQFRSLLNNKKKMRGFSTEEREAIKKVVQGGRLENTAKALGKFGFSEQQASSMLLTSLGAAGGAAVAGPGGAAAVPLAGQAFKTIAQKLTRDNAQLAKRLVSAGSNGERIARAYLASKPKSSRSVEELSALLLDNGVKVESLRKSSNKLIADAAYIASVFSQSGASSVEPANASDNNELKNQDRN